MVSEDDADEAALEREMRREEPPARAATTPDLLTDTMTELVELAPPGALTTTCTV